MLHYRVISYFLIFGIIFTILSIPFLMGLISLSYSGGNAYGMFYVVFILPVKLTCSDVAVTIAQAFWDDPSPPQVERVMFLFSVFFWSLLGSVIGYVQDLRGNSAE